MRTVKLKNKFIIGIFSSLLILLVIGVFCSFVAFTISPWEKVFYSSIEYEDYKKSNNPETFSYLKNKYPEYFVNDTFIYICSRAENETVYTAEAPYSLWVRFCSYETRKVEVKKFEITNEDINYDDNDVNFSVILNDKKSQQSNNYDIKVFSTPCIFDLNKNQDKLKIKVTVEIDDEEAELMFTLNRIVRKGNLRWRT